MWKYVTRNFKEKFDRTCNSLDICRGWRCSGINESASSSLSPCEKNCPPSSFDCVKIFSNFYICTTKCEKTSKSGSNNNEKKRKTYKNDRNTNNEAHHELLGAITWGGAIVCGWYTSKILCLNKRQYGWNSHGPYFNIMKTPSREIHTNIFSHWVLASPVYPSKISENTLKEKFNVPAKSYVYDPNYKQKFSISELSNENETTSTSGISSSANSNYSETSNKQSINEAVGDLVKFLGETEFKMGIQQISAGRYRSAVTHLKVASRHHHVGATFNLGLCYEQGLGVSKNLKRAMECYQHASSLGHPKAMYNLGVFYAQGLGGLKKDHEAARQCFVAAAKLGQSEAVEVLGW